MKKVIVTLVLALFAFGAKSAFSQSNFTLRADVPFAFSIDGRHFDSGSYELRTINISTIRLLNTETGKCGLVRLTTSEPVESRLNGATPMLRFVRNGESAYLVSLIDSYGNGWQVRVPPRDLEASRRAQSKTTVVALK
jgi:hypothetical protein